MRRHILLMLALVAGAFAAGVGLVPSEREQWTMFVRDNRNADALQIFEAQYREGRRDPVIVLELYRLLMSFAEIEKATQVIEDFASSRLGDIEAVTLLVRHYADTQNRLDEVRSLERLFDLTLSPNIARDLLAFYRIAGAFEAEEILLRRLLSASMIAANDAERLGLVLASRGDFAGARAALAHFDDSASPDLVLGRLALFDILVKTGDTSVALAKATSWIANWRYVGIDQTVVDDTAAIRLVRLMMSADVQATRTILCDTQYELAVAADDERRGALCAVALADATGAGIVAVRGRRQFGGALSND